MQDMSHQAMGYDRASTMFSPDGRLLQVEYARGSVKLGATTIGMVCKDGVLLVADKRVTEKLIVAESVEKIFQVDEHIGAAATGCTMDGRVLIERSRVIAQQHMVTYGVAIDTLDLVKEICDIKQFYTQYGGARPFGVSILFIGTDDTPVLYVTDPMGVYFEYKATAVGEAEDEIKTMLNKDYKENMTIEDGVKLAINAFKKVLGKDFDLRRIDAAFIKADEKKFTRVDKRKLKL